MKTWWIDPVADEDDLDLFTAFKEHPRQGPLQFQGRLIEVVPKSELTKLRKRVEVLEKALEKYALPQTRLTKKHEEEQWRLEPGFHDPQTAVEALKESAKIAGE